jgi:hypothetical protein
MLNNFALSKNWGPWGHQGALGQLYLPSGAPETEVRHIPPLSPLDHYLAQLMFRKCKHKKTGWGAGWLGGGIDFVINSGTLGCFVGTGLLAQVGLRISTPSRVL